MLVVDAGPAVGELDDDADDYPPAEPAAVINCAVLCEVDWAGLPAVSRACNLRLDTSFTMHMEPILITGCAACCHPDGLWLLARRSMRP